MENLLVILVVEDDHLVLSVVEDSLVIGGFETVIASSGENAVELLDASDDRYADIGITVIMPNHELCRTDLTPP